MTSKNLVLQTVYIDPEVDDLLRNESFADRTSKNDSSANTFDLACRSLAMPSRR